MYFPWASAYLHVFYRSDGPFKQRNRSLYKFIEDVEVLNIRYRIFVLNLVTHLIKTGDRACIQ